VENIIAIIIEIVENFNQNSDSQNEKI